MSFCTPAILYLIVAALSLLRSIQVGFSLFSIIAQIIWAIAFTAFLNFLCNRGYSTLSWIIAFLPIIGLLIAFVGLAMSINVLNSESSSDTSGRRSLRKRLWG